MQCHSVSLSCVFSASQLQSDLPSVLRCFQEEGVDEGDGVGLDLLVGPGGRGRATQQPVRSTVFNQDQSQT